MRTAFLFERPFVLLDDGQGPPRRLLFWNPATGNLEGVGSRASPLIVPGEPPDFMTVDGDLIMVEEG